MARALAERGLLRAEIASDVAIGTGAGAFPDTVQDIVRARIDHLGESVKRTVQTAAVIGREFGLRLLARLSEAPESVPADLAVLRRLELIHEVGVFPEPHYRFKHAVIQDVAYQELLGSRRQRLHAAIGETIEELYADRVDEQAAIIAHHYGRSAHQDRATRWALVAGDRAVRLHARAEATSYYDDAFRMAEALPDAPEARRLRIDATVKLATVGVTRQDLDRDRASLERARALADALADEPRLAQVLYWLGRTHYVSGSTATAVDCAERSLGIADRLGDEALAAPPVNLLGRAYSR
jgi:predicted ATPase